MCSTSNTNKPGSISSRTPHGPVFYDPENRFGILFQCHGSIWPKVLKYCIANTLFVVLLKFLRDSYGVDLECSALGHTFAGMVVSFLLVARLNSGLTRYNECRSNISIMFREARELVQKALVFSRKTKNSDQSAKEWRSEVAYRSLLLLRTTVATIDYPTKHIPAYNVPELSGVELTAVQPNKEFLRHAHIPYGIVTESIRVPIRMAQLLRETLCSQGERLAHPLSANEELNLLASIDHFQSGFYGMRKFMTTPIPFPLVQMAHTLVMVYVFTLPLVFLGDSSSNMWEDCITVFLLTFGFVGLDATSVELDDPFGDDANDFDVGAYAQYAVDDIIIMINDADGVEWADSLRYKMHADVSEPVDEDESAGLLNPPKHSFLWRMGSYQSGAAAV